MGSSTITFYVSASILEILLSHKKRKEFKYISLLCHFHVNLRDRHKVADMYSRVSASLEIGRFIRRAGLIQSSGPVLVRGPYI